LSSLPPSSRGFSLPFVLACCLAPALVACGDDVGDPTGSPHLIFGGGGASGTGGAGPGPVDAEAEDGLDPGPSDADPAIYNCPEIPTAYVLEGLDDFTLAQGQGAQLLAAAGFDVKPLPLDGDPRHLRGLIYFGSFISQNPAYREFVSRHAVGLYTFVDAANVLVQMSQADQTEASPPFLPNSQIAHRADPDAVSLHALDPQHPLLAGIPLDPSGVLRWQFDHVGWETFDQQQGFAVLLAGDRDGRRGALMEGAYSQGRFILTALTSDKPVGLGPDRDQFNQAFFRNLFDYVRSVCRRQAKPVKLTPTPDRPGFTEGSTMLAVLPDTQYYALNYPGVYDAQTAWIATHAQRRNIKYVLHLGDIVDQNTPREWQRAAQSMSLLDGIVPYALVPGNHDLGPGGNATTRDTLMNRFFPFEVAAKWPTFGGAYQPGRLENTYHYFSMGGRDYIVLALEWGPRDEVVEWADQVMTQHPDRWGIMITHAYMNNNDLRYDINDTAHPQDFNPHVYGTAGTVNDGEELWRKLISKHRFVMTFNGHVLGDGTGYLASVTSKGNTCHQMLSNYQFRNLGGEGYMRLVEFLPDGHMVRVYTYSPLYDSFLVEPDQNYSFTLDVPRGKPPVP
jgi:3',5'-cyclic AMP phosphodiesterase CpdA